MMCPTCFIKRVFLTGDFADTIEQMNFVEVDCVCGGGENLFATRSPPPVQSISVNNFL